MTEQPAQSVQERMVADLAKSGLTPEDLGAYPINESVVEACRLQPGLKGYVIPYYDITGKRLDFYRVKLFNSDPKYMQPRNTQNHIYIPKNFLKVLKAVKHKSLIITEGEKKALALTKLGFPAVAVSGVDSWKTKSITLPAETEFTEVSNGGKKEIRALLPDESDQETGEYSKYAEGFYPLIDIINQYKFTAVIVYDTDSVFGVKPNVQRACAVLGHELRHLGLKLTQVKQLVLPVPEGEESISVDEFLYHEDCGISYFQTLYKQILKNDRAFPRHPNPREFVNKKLGRSKVSRKDIKALGLAVVSELDSTGRRMKSLDENQMYYFDGQTAKLMKVDLNTSQTVMVQSTEFGKLLYQRYGVSPAADSSFIKWLGQQFEAEDPIDEVHPHRVLARPDYKSDRVCFQISDGRFVTIDAKGTHFHNNGDNGVLFESDRVEAVDEERLKKAIVELRKEPLSMWWDDVLSESRLRERGDHQTLHALLYYISPWLYRWRGTQLPVELVIGEAGSGKSSLCELRLKIQTGKADLKNAPTDIKDWHAALSNSGGMHVTDNVQLLNKGLRTTLSDEICRLITEPQPHVEMRKLYTNADVARIKVDNVFCFTAIAQPFMAADLLQRAVIIEFDKSQYKSLAYDSNWMSRQLDSRGGREYWLAHHFVVLERFFAAVEESWNPNYQAKHRLINFEQSLRIMAKKVFGINDDWIPAKLEGDVAATVASNDWALEGLQEFARAYYAKKKQNEFTANAITTWAETHPEFAECIMLKNARKLGIYIKNSKHMVHQIAGIIEVGKKSNKMMYRIDPDKVKKD